MGGRRWLVGHPSWDTPASLSRHDGARTSLMLNSGWATKNDKIDSFECKKGTRSLPGFCYVENAVLQEVTICLSTILATHQCWYSNNPCSKASVDWSPSAISLARDAQFQFFLFCFLFTLWFVFGWCWGGQCLLLVVLSCKKEYTISPWDFFGMDLHCCSPWRIGFSAIYIYIYIYRMVPPWCIQSSPPAHSSTKELASLFYPRSTSSKWILYMLQFLAPVEMYIYPIIGRSSPDVDYCGRLQFSAQNRFILPGRKIQKFATNRVI